ncbi:hypothetical protein [Acidovorax sp.]|jgi:glucans biosynthesis protein C|uniref:hypothetical protein n=1 Tax=Acidovorax sp. TaxID=1872122 RepID=UPI00391EF3C8
MNPLLHTPTPAPETGWRALLLQPTGHWPLYAVAGTACLLLAGVLAESAAQPEALALALFLFTGVLIDALLAPATAGRGLHTAMVLLCHAAALLFGLALAGALQQRRGRQPGLRPA